MAAGDDYTHFVRWIGTDLVRKGVEIQIRGDRPIKWTATPPKEMQPFQVQLTPDRQKVVIVYGPLTRRLRDGAADAAPPAAGASCTIVTYEARTGRELHRVPATQKPTGHIQLSPDGRLLAAHAFAVPQAGSPEIERGSLSLVVVDLIDGTVSKKWQLAAGSIQKSILFAFSPTEPKLFIVEPQDSTNDSGGPKRSSILGIWEFPTAPAKGRP